MSLELKKELKKLLIALCIFLVFLIADKTGLVPVIFENRWISLIFYLIPYLMVGREVLVEGVSGILHGEMLDEDFLMTLASIGAFVVGQNEEAAAVMLFFQLGEWFEHYALGQSRKSISELMDIAPDTAFLESADGTLKEIDPKEIKVGDILAVRPGEKVPTDGLVISGESMLDTAALTGESVPRSARPGDEIISGCINGAGLLRIRASKAYEDSTIARILELVEEATEKKSHRENFITRFARYYTPIVVGAAVLLAILPSIITGNWLTWIYRACTFLVISCPCALVISVPLAFFGGIGASSRNGILVKGSSYLELLANIDTLVSDKTGTLTEGNFAVTHLYPAEGVSERELIVCAAAAEAVSTHPIAQSLMEALTDEEKRSLPEVAGNENRPGMGLISRVGEVRIAVGNAQLMEALRIPYRADSRADATVCYVARDHQFLGSIFISDSIKKNAREAIPAIKESGVRQIVMLTGDREPVANAVASELGIDRTMSELLPQDKVNKVEELLKEEHSGALAFLGDGMNDAPTLSRADVGIAMGAIGSDAAIEAADVVIMDDDLMRLPKAIGIARRTVRISTENIIFALAVKFLILILGALGLTGMWAAVFADVGVAFLCILNSMRLLLVKMTI